MLHCTYDLLNEFKLELELRYRLINLGKDSGTGKTFISQQIECLKKLNKKEFQDFVILNNEDAYKNFLQENHDNKIIILDRADMFVPRFPDIVDKINKDIKEKRNHYIICSRSSLGFSIEFQQYTKLCYLEEEKTFYIKYYLTEARKA